jgi:hypothetical protein
MYSGDLSDGALCRDPLRGPRRTVDGSNFSARMAASTRRAVSGLTHPNPLTTRETVEIETPAASAMCDRFVVSVIATINIRQNSNKANKSENKLQLTP